MLATFSSLYLVIVAVGGVAALVLGYSWFSYRLAAVAGSAAQGMAVTPLRLNSYVCVYGYFLLPWVTALWGVRGFTAGGGAMSLALEGLVFQRALLVAQWLGVFFIAGRVSLGFSSRWVLELGGSWLVLQLCWTLFGQCGAVLTLLLWLEIAGLGGLLLLSVSALSTSEAATPWLAWRGAFVTRQLQLGFLQAALVFLWTSGVATFLLLWGLSLRLQQAGGYASDALFLGLAFQQSSLSLTAGGWGSILIGGGVLVKLLLQPMQFALITFYRHLRLETLVLYLTAYYCCFIPLFFHTFFAYLILLLGGWELLLLGCVGGLSCVLAQGATAGSDIRSTLAYSTAVNLSILLLVLSLA